MAWEKLLMMINNIGVEAYNKLLIKNLNARGDTKIKVVGTSTATSVALSVWCQTASHRLRIYSLTL